MLGTLTIRGGELALAHGIVRGDVQIVDGTIAAIGTVERDLGELIDARGLLVMPGVIDPQVHFREPGATHKEDLRTGSEACAAGGVTSFLEMPNTNPPTTTREAFEAKMGRAEEVCVVNYGFFIGATRDNLALGDAIAGAAGIKVFMGSSTGDLLVADPDDLERIFATGRRLIAVHAEDEARLTARKKLFAGRTDPAVHSELRDVETALAATRLALSLSAKYARRLHILHLSTGDEVAAIALAGKGQGRVTCEVTPQHLLLAAPEVYERLGTKAQMNPPLRTREHCDALWAGLKSGTIDCIATDHAPHTLEEKSRGYGRAPSGMPGVETSLALMLDASHRGLCAMEDVVRWMCEAPARSYGMIGKGRLALGMDGDVVLVDRARTERVGARGYFTKVAWSPFEGVALTGWPKMTIVAGRPVFRDNRIVPGALGRAIRFEA